MLLLDEPVRVHDAERIGAAREAADLHEQRPILWYRERLEDARDLHRGQHAVLVRERVDRRLDDVLRVAEPPSEPRQREDRAVVLVDERAEDAPGATL